VRRMWQAYILLPLQGVGSRSASYPGCRFACHGAMDFWPFRPLPTESASAGRCLRKVQVQAVRKQQGAVLAVHKRILRFTLPVRGLFMRERLNVLSAACCNMKGQQPSRSLPLPCYPKCWFMKNAYSYLMASIGSSRAAFLAGYHPKNTPVKVQTAKLMMMVHHSM